MCYKVFEKNSLFSKLYRYVFEYYVVMKICLIKKTHQKTHLDG